jgi:plastocyanin
VRLRIETIGLVLVVVAACGSGGETTSIEPPPPATATVTLTAAQFVPATTTIRVGGTVSFVNSSGVLHDVDFGTPQFHIAAWEAGTRSLVFPTAGTLSYHCNLHAGMEATLVVR